MQHSPCNVIHRSLFLVFSAVLLPAEPLLAEEILGEILSIDQKRVSIRVSGQRFPSVGDPFEVFENIPGVGRAEAAVGRITETTASSTSDSAVSENPGKTQRQTLIVIGVIPQSSAAVRPGQQVAIESTLPQAVDGVGVPILIARSAADAQATLVSLGFRVNLRLGIEAPEGVAPFTVYRQEPKYFTRARPGSTIIVELYTPASDRGTDSTSESQYLGSPVPGMRTQSDSAIQHSTAERIQGRWLCVGAYWRGHYALNGQGTELLIRGADWHWIGVLPAPAHWTLVEDKSDSSAILDVEFAPLPTQSRSVVAANGLNPTRFDGRSHRVLVNMEGDRLTMAESDYPAQAPANLESADWTLEFRRMSDRPNINRVAPLEVANTPSLGAVVSDIGGYSARAAGVQADRGVFVHGVVRGTAAADGGIQSGDVLLSFNDDPVNDYREVPLRIRTFRTGEQISVSLQRGVMVLNKTVRLTPQLDGESLQADIRRQALDGAAWAQTMVGRWVKDGFAGGVNGKSGDAATAADWFRRAADQGDADAQNMLALLYETGNGVPQDVAKAASLYRQAADQGHQDAQVNYGNLLSRGDTVPKDLAAAFDYYQRAAAQESSRGLHNVAVCYEFGLGVPVNPQAAFEYYLRASAAGQAESCAGAGYCLARGVGVTAEPEAAIDWYRLAADRGDLTGLVRLAAAYRKGNGIPQDFQKALAHLQDAVDAEVPHAMTMIGEMHRLGEGVEKDPKLAMEWFQKGAAAGDPQAHRMIGVLIRQGSGVRQEFDKAKGWFEAASRLGDSDAEIEIGKLYEQGLGVTPSRPEAIRHYRLAHERGNESAAEELRRLGVSP